jgi:predicted SnoaL-like aldol condensation-catalyzing enzyme
MVENGIEPLSTMVKSFLADFSYKPGLVIAQGDYVAIHGRYTGFGPGPMIAVDIFRIEKGKIAEQWDVLQPEVAANQSRNGNPMFLPEKP